VNGFDVAMLVLLALSALAGFRRGFVLEVAGILGAVVALAVARVEYADVRATLEQFAPHSPWLTIVAYLLVFLVIWGAIIIVARKIRALVRLMMLGWLDRMGGVAIGLIQGALLVELLLYFTRRVPNGELRHLANHSTLAPVFLSVMPLLTHFFPHVPR
jgi:membrane protein required for colicin V production